MRVAQRIALWLALVVTMSAFSQTFEPDQLMLLVIGRSASRPDANQIALLERVQALRKSPGLSGLQVATMHFDRPREASFARQVLGVTAQQLPCVCLVQLDASRQRPLRSLYCWPVVTGSKLAQVDAMAESWAKLASQPMPLLAPQAPPATAAGAQVLALPIAPLAPPAPAVPQVRDRVFAGVSLPTDSWLRSHNGIFGCTLQVDGNLVVYRLTTQPFQPMWNSQTSSQGVVSMRLSTDGVLRLLGQAGQVVWQSGEPRFFSHRFLQLQDDGNLVIYRQDGNGLSVDWSSNGAGQAP